MVEGTPVSKVSFTIVGFCLVELYDSGRRLKPETTRVTGKNSKRTVFEQDREIARATAGTQRASHRLSAAM
jgi:hypothetical protein